MAKTAIGLFDSRRQADDVVRALKENGFTDSEMRVLASPVSGVSPTPSGLDRPGNRAYAGTGTRVGNTEWLKIGGVPEEDAVLYWEGVQRGSVAVVVTSQEACAEADRVDEAARIMDEHGAVDVEARCGEWAKSGWRHPLTRAAGRGMSPPRGEGTVQVGRYRVEGGGARVFVW